MNHNKDLTSDPHIAEMVGLAGLPISPKGNRNFLLANSMPPVNVYNSEERNQSEPSNYVGSILFPAQSYSAQDRVLGNVPIEIRKLEILKDKINLHMEVIEIKRENSVENLTDRISYAILKVNSYRQLKDNIYRQNCHRLGEVIQLLPDDYFQIAFQIGGNVICSASHKNCKVYGINTQTALFGTSSSFILTCPNTEVGLLTTLKKDSISITCDTVKETLDYIINEISEGVLKITFYPTVVQLSLVNIRIKNIDIPSSPLKINVIPQITYSRRPTQSVLLPHSDHQDYDGICCTPEGDIVLCSSKNNQINVYSFNGELKVQFGCQGNKNGQFQEPKSVHFDHLRRIVVADSRNHRIQFFSPDGKYLEKFAKPGPGNGQLNYPFSAAVDSSGRLAVADILGSENSQNHRFQLFTNNYKAICSVTRFNLAMFKVFHSMKPSITYGILLDMNPQNVTDIMYDVLPGYNKVIYDNNGRLVAIKDDGISILNPTTWQQEKKISLECGSARSDFTIDPIGRLHILVNQKVVTMEF